MKTTKERSQLIHETIKAIRGHEKPDKRVIAAECMKMGVSVKVVTMILKGDKR